MDKKHQERQTYKSTLNFLYAILGVFVGTAFATFESAGSGLVDRITPEPLSGIIYNLLAWAHEERFYLSLVGIVIVLLLTIKVHKIING